MLNYNGKEYRNLQEQVLKNKEDIAAYVKEASVLNQFGIKVVGVQQFPPSDTEQPGEAFGDAIAVGVQPPYTLYIWTRVQGSETEGYWFNIGEFPAPSTTPGPSGEIGPEGPSGQRGSLWYSQQGGPNITGAQQNDQWLNGATGDVYQYVGTTWVLTGNIRGPRGPQGLASTVPGPQGIPGEKGEKGEKGDTGTLINLVGELNNSAQLPDPESVEHNTAYLITQGTPPAKHIYVIVGVGTEAMWVDAGTFGGTGTIITLDGTPRAELDVTNVLDGLPSYGINSGTGVAVADGSVTFTGMAAYGNNLDGNTVTDSSKQIRLPIGASDEIEPISVNNILTFTLSDAYKAQLEQKLSSAGAVAVNILAPTTSTQGTLTADQFTTLSASDSNYIVLNGEIFILQDKMTAQGYWVYTHVGSTGTRQYVKTLAITLSTYGWVLTTNYVISDQDKLFVYDVTMALTYQSYFDGVALNSSMINLSTSVTYMLHTTIVTTDDYNDYHPILDNTTVPFSGTIPTNMRGGIFLAHHCPQIGSNAITIAPLTQPVKAFNGVAHWSGGNEIIPVGICWRYDADSWYQMISSTIQIKDRVPVIIARKTDDTITGNPGMICIPINNYQRTGNPVTGGALTGFNNRLYCTLNKIQAYPINQQDLPVEA